MEHRDDAPLADGAQPGAVPSDQPTTADGEEVGAPAGEPVDEEPA